MNNLLFPAQVYFLFLHMHFKPPFLDSEFKLKTSRSGGKGGQNVNKTSSKVMLEFSIPDSLLLSDEEKNMLTEKLASRLTKDGTVQVMAQTDRSQLGNREMALKKMYALLNRCFVVKKKRKASKPGKAAVEKRLSSKKKQSRIKANRSHKPAADE